MGHFFKGFIRFFAWLNYESMDWTGPMISQDDRVLIFHHNFLAATYKKNGQQEEEAEAC